MLVSEIILPRKSTSKNLHPKKVNSIEKLQSRMQAYVDKICDPETDNRTKEILKSKLADDYSNFKIQLSELKESKISICEAIHKLPLSNEDFDVLKEVMNNPIPAIVAPIYLQNIIDDDELNDNIDAIQKRTPNKDVRQMIANWIDRVMPDQMYRFRDEHRSEDSRLGMLSPLHGYNR